MGADMLPKGSVVVRHIMLTRSLRLLNAVVMALLIWMGALRFKRVLTIDEKQIPHAMQVSLPAQRLRSTFCFCIM